MTRKKVSNGTVVTAAAASEAFGEVTDTLNRYQEQTAKNYADLVKLLENGVETLTRRFDGLWSAVAKAGLQPPEGNSHATKADIEALGHRLGQRMYALEEMIRGLQCDQRVLDFVASQQRQPTEPNPQPDGSSCAAPFLAAWFRREGWAPTTRPKMGKGLWHYYVRSENVRRFGRRALIRPLCGGGPSGQPPVRRKARGPTCQQCDVVRLRRESSEAAKP